MHPFAIDSRSLSLFRIGLGIVAIYYFITHWQVFDEFHSSQKAASTAAVRAYYGEAWRWSLNWWSESSAYQVALLVVGLAAASCLIVGWHSKLATAGCWLLVTSLNNNAPYIASGGDALLGVLLFWSLFLPLGQRWSLDARRGSAKNVPPAATLLSAATAALLLQMAMMYFFTGISKWNTYWIDGSALDVVFSSDSFVRPPGKLLQQFSLVTNFLSRTTLWAELLLPLVMFSPWKTTLCRSVGVLTFMSFHVGIELSLTVLIFSVVSFVGLLPFIPSRWWDFFPLHFVEQRFHGLQQRFNTLEQPFHLLFRRPQAGSQVSRQQRRRNARADSRVNSPFWHVAGSWAQKLCVVLIVYVFLCNVLLMFGSSETITRLRSVQQPGFLLGINQYWNMFSSPPSLCMDVACVARLRDGTQVDLLRAGQRVGDRKQPPSDPLVDCSTRMLNGLVQLSGDTFRVFRQGYTQHLCARWNEAVQDSDQKIIECFLTYYPRQHHPLAEHLVYRDLFHEDFLAQGALVQGKRQGPWILYHENGQKMSAGNYQLGQAIGKWTFWDPSGSLVAEGIMQNGKPVGKWKHYEGGELKIVDHSQPMKPSEPPQTAN